VKFTEVNDQIPFGGCTDCQPDLPSLPDPQQ
jgi:hypothetical protein